MLKSDVMHKSSNFLDCAGGTAVQTVTELNILYTSVDMIYLVILLFSVKTNRLSEFVCRTFCLEAIVTLFICVPSHSAITTACDSIVHSDTSVITVTSCPLKSFLFTVCSGIC